MLASLAIAATAAMLAPAPAQADASRYSCTIESLGFSLWRTDWPSFKDDTFHWDVTLSGQARCTTSDGTYTATLSGDAQLEAEDCYPAGTGSARLEGTLQFVSSPGGLRDARPFRIALANDLGRTTEPATMTVDGGTGSVVNWHFTETGSRCSAASSDVSRIDYSGTFSVPVSRTNPKLFARPPVSPGHPDPIAYDASSGRVYVGSFTSAAAALSGTAPPDVSPSKVWAYDTAGNAAGSWTIAGQTLTKAHGLTGIALDAAGRLYITDVAPARVIRLDPVTGLQTTYATLRDLKPCDAGGTPGDCSQESSDFGDRPPLPNGAAFGPDGSLYVTDTTQGAIWKVPPGGGTARLWLTDPRFKSYIGPNGIRLMADQRTLIFVFSNSQPPGSTDQLQGAIYKAQINADGTAGPASRFWLGGTNEGPDSLALAQSGNVYVALAGDGLRSGFVVLSPTGAVLTRRSSPVDRLTADIAYDTVADVTFVGTRAIFTNSSNFGNNAANYAIFAYDAGEAGQSVLRPTVP